MRDLLADADAASYSYAAVDAVLLAAVADEAANETDTEREVVADTANTSSDCERLLGLESAGLGREWLPRRGSLDGPASRLIWGCEFDCPLAPFCSCMGVVSEEDTECDGDGCGRTGSDSSPVPVESDRILGTPAAAEAESLLAVKLGEGSWRASG